MQTHEHLRPRRLRVCSHLRYKSRFRRRTSSGYARMYRYIPANCRSVLQSGSVFVWCQVGVSLYTCTNSPSHAKAHCSRMWTTRGLRPEALRIESDLRRAPRGAHTIWGSIALGWMCDLMAICRYSGMRKSFGTEQTVLSVLTASMSMKTKC